MDQRSATSAESSAADDLMFVNVSHPDDIRRQKGVQKDIRRHVMKNIGFERRRPKSKGKKKPPGRSTTPSTSEEKQSLSEIDVEPAASPGRSLEVFGGFPIPGNKRVIELVRFLSESSSFYLPFRRAWFEVALTDPGAFHVTLGNSATLSLSVNSNEATAETPEITRHYSHSLMLLNKRLKVPSERTSQGTAANILAHICLNMRHRNWDSWKVHMNGLSQVVKARGGLSTLRYPMPILTAQYDLSAAMVFDSPPLFPLPADLAEPDISISEAPPRLQAFLLQVGNKPFDIAGAGKALQLLSRIANMVNLNSHSALFWTDDMGAFSLIGPVIHCLLSMPRFSSDFVNLPNADDLIMREMVRLIGLVLMSKLKEMFAFFSIETAVLQEKFAHFVPYTRRLSKTYLEVKLWALVTAALLDTRDNLGYYLDEIARDTPAIQQDGSDIVENAKGFVWINALESPIMDDIMHDIMLPAAARSFVRDD
ncbi:hypothetical protein V8C35DRAFT_309827 [Trichoderma chlorosporum]